MKILLDVVVLAHFGQGGDVVLELLLFFSNGGKRKADLID